LVFEGKPVEIGVGRGVDGTAGNDVYFNGMIDEIYIWERGLSEDEIQKLAQGSRPSLSIDSMGKLAISWGAIKIKK
jgi:hypothetical protein